MSQASAGARATSNVFSRRKCFSFAHFGDDWLTLSTTLPIAARELDTAMCFRGILERIDPVDDGAQARSDFRPKLDGDAGGHLALAGKRLRTKQPAGDECALGHQSAQRQPNRRQLTARHVDDVPAVRDQTKIARDPVRSGQVEDDVRAAVARRLADGLAQLVVAVAAHGSAKGGKSLALCRAAGRGDSLRAADLRNLDRGDADAACCAEDQQGATGRQLSELDGGVPSGQKRLRPGGALGRLHRRRHREAQAGIGGAVLRIPTAVDEGGDTRADRHPVRTAVHNLAGYLQAGEVGSRAFRRGAPLALADVVAVYAGGGHMHEDFARTESWALAGLCAEDVGSSDRHRPHGVTLHR